MKQNLIKGDFKWKDSDKKEVVFVPNKNGRFLLNHNPSKKYL